jgi:hypothetical protein
MELVKRAQTMTDLAGRILANRHKPVAQRLTSDQMAELAAEMEIEYRRFEALVSFWGKAVVSAKGGFAGAR